MSNKQIGNKLEDYVCKLFGEDNWWVHKLAQTEIGQPADIIAIKHNEACLIDCKYCQDDKFVLSRVKPNQLTAMQRWVECGNDNAYFYIYFDKSNAGFFVPFTEIRGMINRGEKSIHIKDIMGDTLPF